MKKTYPIVVIGSLVFAVSFAGMVANAYLATHPVWGVLFYRWALSVTLISIAIITFFGFLWYAQKQGGKWALHNGGMRLVIVISVLTVYLVFVGIVVFFEAPKEVPELSSTMISHFSSVVLLIVGFYFATSAYVEVKEKKKENDLPKKENDLAEEK